MDAALLIPITGILMPLGLVPAIIAMKHAQRKREWEHLERMKALELGRPLPGSDRWHALAATTIGAGVPAGAFLCAWLASLTAPGHEHEIYWSSATLVSVFGVVGGVALAWRMLSLRKPARLDDTPFNGKPVVDPDAYDVVSQRG